MKRKTDLAIVQEASRTAANAARFGSASARDGQVDERRLALSQLVEKIRKRAEDATNTWAHWESINEFLIPESEARLAIDHFNLAGLASIRMALSRDAILTAYRLSDPFDPKKPDDLKKLTLCRLAHELGQSDLAASATKPDWLLDRGVDPIVADYAAIQNAGRVVNFQQSIVADWTKPAALRRTFIELRNILKPIRDKTLAHAIDDPDLTLATIDEFRKFIEITLNLATDMAFVFRGHAPSSEDVRQQAAKRAKDFWVLAFDGPIGARTVDMQKRKRAAAGE